MDISNLSMKEMVNLRDRLNNAIIVYRDGFQYECKIRSYGRNWTRQLYNDQSVQELCYEYDGDEGIVDVYTTNPNLNLYNYGNTYYFPTLEDAEAWRNYKYLENHIPEWKQAIEEWDNRENIPFRDRPSFAPYIKEDEIATYEKQVSEQKEIIIMPVRLVYTEPERCPNCGESENLHANLDLTKSDSPVSEFLCNECGTYFPPKSE
jgi:DNA-directed RNA polymerase subunit M/transcription elongation factor TFIIS